MVKALKALDAGELRSDEWMHMEGVILYRGRVYVLDNPQLHHDLVHAHHSTIVIRHPGHWKMLELVSRNYWWPGLSRYVTNVTNRDACVTCHTRHTSVTDFRPKLGNPMEVTLVTSPKLYIVSHAKGTDFP